jgi:hypothetical protein
MPWSTLAWWLSEHGPTDLGVHRTRHGAPPPPDGAGCRPAGPLHLGVAGEQRWIPPLLELLHVRWVVSAHPLGGFPGTTPVGGAAGASRFEVIDARPVALLSPSVVRVPSAAAAEQRIFEAGLDLRRSALVLEGAAPELASRSGEPVAAVVTERRPGGWTVELPPVGGLLTIAERHHPGWQAQAADGSSLTVLPANLVQLAVAVPEGVERVELRFRPAGLRLGLLGGLSGVVALLGLLLLGPAPRRRR